MNNDRIPESIDTVKIIKNSDRNTIAFENPKTFISSNAEEQAALDAWKELESFNPYAFNTTYLKAARRGLPAHLFYQFVSEIKQSNAEKPGAVFNKKLLIISNHTKTTMTKLTESDLKAFQEAVYKDYGVMIPDALLYQEAFNLLQFIEALIKFDQEDKKNNKKVLNTST